VHVKELPLRFKGINNPMECNMMRAQSKLKDQEMEGKRGEEEECDHVVG